MLNVLIIDDDLKDSKDLEMLCIHYFNKRNIDHKISIELKLNENLRHHQQVWVDINQIV